MRSSLTGWNEPQLMALSRDGTLWTTNRFSGQVMRLNPATETDTLINVCFGPGGGVLRIGAEWPSGFASGLRLRRRRSVLCPVRRDD